MRYFGTSDPITMEQFRKSPRAHFLDYEEGDFFITVCVSNMRKHYFGEIVNGIMVYSELGEFLDRELNLANTYNNRIKILIHQVMPNHFHAIVRINPEKSPVSENSVCRSPNPSLRINPDTKRHVTALSKYMSSLKGSVTKYARRKGISFEWQNRFHDHFIRGNEDGDRIWNYIENNVTTWEKDRHNPVNTFSPGSPADL